MEDHPTDWALASKQLVALLVVVPPVVAVTMFLLPTGGLTLGILWGVLLSLLTWLSGVHYGLLGNPETANRFVGR